MWPKAVSSTIANTMSPTLPSGAVRAAGSLFLLDQGEARAKDAGEREEGPAETGTDGLAQDPGDNRDRRAWREPAAAQVSIVATSCIIGGGPADGSAP